MDHPCLFRPAPSPWSHGCKIVRVQGRNFGNPQNSLGHDQGKPSVGRLPTQLFLYVGLTLTIMTWRWNGSNKARYGNVFHFRFMESGIFLIYYKNTCQCHEALGGIGVIESRALTDSYYKGKPFCERHDYIRRKVVTIKDQFSFARGVCQHPPYPWW